MRLIIDYKIPLFPTKISRLKPRTSVMIPTRMPAFAGSVAIVRGLITSLSEDSRYSEQEEWKILHTSYLCSEAFHLRV